LAGREMRPVHQFAFKSHAAANIVQPRAQSTCCVFLLQDKAS
jgi:hypothetical protein